MAEHLLGGILQGPVRRGHLDCVVLRLVVPNGLDIRGNLTVLQLYKPFCSPSCEDQKFEHTWRTVTGNLTPWLSHITVIPLLRAMRPVRTEVGVQVLVDADEDSTSAVALLTTVEWNALHRGKTGRVPKDQSLSMVRDSSS